MKNHVRLTTRLYSIAVLYQFLKLSNPLLQVKSSDTRVILCSTHSVLECNLWFQVIIIFYDMCYVNKLSSHNFSWQFKRNKSSASRNLEPLWQQWILLMNFTQGTHKYFLSCQFPITQFDSWEFFSLLYCMWGILNFFCCNNFPLCGIRPFSPKHLISTSYSALSCGR